MLIEMVKFQSAKIKIPLFPSWRRLLALWHLPKQDKPADDQTSCKVGKKRLNLFLIL